MSVSVPCLVSVIILVIFLLIFGGITSLPATPVLRWGALAFGLFMWATLLIPLIISWNQLRPNRGLRVWWKATGANHRNTVFTIFATIPVFTFLYYFQWWPQLRKPTIEVSSEPIVRHAPI
jgi:hypothetical protein